MYQPQKTQTQRQTQLQSLQTIQPPVSSPPQRSGYKQISVKTNLDSHSGQKTELIDQKCYQKLRILAYVLLVIVLILSTILFSYFFTPAPQHQANKHALQKGNDTVYTGMFQFNLDNKNIHSKSIFKDKRIITYYNYDQELQVEKFGRNDRFFINISGLKGRKWDEYTEFVNSQLNTSQIQIGTKFDMNISQIVNFTQLKTDLMLSIPHQTFQFYYNKSSQQEWISNQSLSLIKINRSQMEIRKYLVQIGDQQGDQNNQRVEPSDVNFYLALKLLRNPEDREALQAQYYLANKKYGIGNIPTQKQPPICILSTQYNIFSKNRYKKYFQSLSSLNYTNFHIVYVDDNSNDNSALRIFSYLLNSPQPQLGRIRNRIRIVRNMVQIGGLANMYYHASNYCGSEDIVVNIDADDGVTGRQGFKIVGRIYQNMETWYLYTGYMITRTDSDFIYKGKQSLYLRFPTHQYRLSFQWETSHMRTFRQFLVTKIPVQTLLQYHIDVQQNQNRAFPCFHQSAQDLFLTFPMMEMAGNDRIQHIDEYIYSYYGSSTGSKTCYRSKQIYEDFKSRLKTPLAKLRKREDQPEKQLNYEIDQIDFQRVKAGFDNYVQCLIRGYQKQ